MHGHRHEIIYFASDEGSRSKPFEPFNDGGQEGFSTVHLVSQVGDNAYEIVFYSYLDEHAVAYVFEEIQITILQQRINQRTVSEVETLREYLWQEPDDVAAE